MGSKLRDMVKKKRVKKTKVIVCFLLQTFLAVSLDLLRLCVRVGVFGVGVFGELQPTLLLFLWL